MSARQGCRFCGCELNETFIDLGISPLANTFLTEEDLQHKEVFYPLHAKLCKQCFLVQLPQLESPENIFSDYAYFSSYSTSWLNHASAYTEMMINRFGINKNGQVIEIASNDGYLLQYFKDRGIPVLGIEPAANVAKAAESIGIPTRITFFGQAVAEAMCQEGICADLLIANNVLAHVPNLNDFVAGLKVVLKPEGVITVEFPHLLRLIEGKQFDTIYHEHFSYFSLLAVQQVFLKHHLQVFDVEEISVHGGSLRIFLKHFSDKSKLVASRVASLIEDEKKFGLECIQTYKSFSENISKLKFKLLDFFLETKKSGRKVVGYGAPAKGNTLLNYCNIDAGFLDYTVDKNPYKQNRYLPGSHIPIFHPDRIRETQPDYVFILPWNLKQEIMEQLDYIKEWNGKFVISVPDLQII